MSLWLYFKKIMKFPYLLFYLSFLFACVSSEKKSYKLPEEKSPSQQKRKSLSRDIAYLQNNFYLEENSFQFIKKKMKTVIKNYKRMKKQLAQIEGKLDDLLNKLIILEEKAHSSIPEDNESISITQRDNQIITIPLSDMEDHKKLMGEILAGDYDIDESEKEKLLDDLKNKVQALKSAEKEKEPFLIEEKLEDDDDVFPKKEPEEDIDSLQSQPKILKGPMPHKIHSTLKEAKNLFKNKSYENAISKFQDYRNKYPAGSYYPEATFFIGQSFQNLQMPLEAKVFFKEITISHPQSLWAEKAQKFLEK